MSTPARSGPKRCPGETVDTVIAFLAASPQVRTLDLTGGAPELNRHFRRLVIAARALGVRVIDRCNLTILEEPGQEGLAEFLAAQGVEVVASMPCYLEENVDRQRGKGTFGASIRGLQALNALGSRRCRSASREASTTRPRLTALLIAAPLLNAGASVALIAVAMAIGGVIFARKVAETMSQRVTRMDHAQGLAANLITAGLVLFASKLGLPVSTTHVAVGSIGGVGASAGTLDRQALRNILLSWIATLPVAACAAWLVSRLG
jgi:hypothetical protein